VSALITLYSSQEDRESAADVLKTAVDWYHANDVSKILPFDVINCSLSLNCAYGKPFKEVY
jgi:hypothetical protein